MGRPQIDFIFQTAANHTIRFGEKGILAIIVKDNQEVGAHTVRKASQIPKGLSAQNQDYIAMALKGYINPPKSICLSVLPAAASDLSKALTYLETQQFDYLVAPPDVQDAEVAEVRSWIAEQREQKHRVKAVLPNCAADSEAIVNFTAEEIQVGAQTYTTAGYCSRIAGILAGTPWVMSATYAPLPEVTGIKQKTGDEIDTDIDAGKLVLLHDGRKVKIARAVNSLQSLSDTKSAIFKKIKIVEAMDRIYQDLYAAIEDSYIGKYANSYDNKMLLVSACRQYFYNLERAGIVAKGSTTADLDTNAISAYLEAQGIDTSEIAEADLKSADTGSHVFLVFGAKILDSIEDVTGKINL